MTTYYIDLVSGNDANDGTTWALAKKTIPSNVGPVLQFSGDVFNVAKTPSVDVGSVTFTNASSDIKLNTPIVATLFDEYGDTAGNALTGAQVTANTAYEVFAPTLPSSLRLVSNYLTFYTGNSGSAGYGVPRAIGNVTFTSTFLGAWNPSNGAYLVLKVSKHSHTDLSISVNGNHQGTGGIGKTSSIVSLDGKTTVTRNITRSGVNAAGDLPGLSGLPTVLVDGFKYIWFDMNIAGLQGLDITSLTIFSYNGTAGIYEDQRVYGAFFVNNFPQPTLLALDAGLTTPAVSGCGLPRRVAGYSNQALGIVGGSHVTISTFFVAGSATRTDACVAGKGQIAWQGASTTANGDLIFGINASSINTEATFDATVKFGMNTATDVQDGCTAMFAQSKNGSFATIGSQSRGKLSGLSCYGQGGTSTGVTFNFRAAAGGTYFNAGTVDLCEVSTFGTGISAENPGSTCPVKAFVHYKNLGPNTTDITTAGSLASCTQWSIAPTKAFASTTTSAAAMLLGTALKITFLADLYGNVVMSAGKLRNGGFSTTTSAVPSFAGGFNRGFAFPSTTSSTITTFLKKATGISYLQSAASANTFAGTVARGIGFSAPVAVTTSIANPQYDKGFAMDVPVYSGNVWSFAPIIGMAWSSITNSSVVQTIQRNRGYEFLSTNAVVVAQGVAVARDAAFVAVNNVAVTGAELIKANFMEFSAISAASAVTASIRLNNAVRFISTSTSSLTTALLATRPVTFVSTHTSAVVAAIGRSRATTFVVGAASTVENNYSRLKDGAFSVVANSAFTAFLRKQTKVAWSSTATSFSLFSNNTLMSFASTSTGGAVMGMLNRLRPVSLSVAQMTQNTFGVGVNKAQDFSASGTSVVAITPAFNRGLFFTVPMTTTMTANFARVVGEQFAAQALPVISFFLNKEYVPGFTVVSVSGNTMVVEMQRPLEMAVGMLVDITGEVVVARPSAAFVEGTSGNSNAIGVARGVQFHVTETSDNEMTMTRSITLTWGSSNQSQTLVRSNSNRLDEFYVDYEAPFSETLSDGSIVLGKRKVSSSGILQNQHPVYATTISPAPVFTVTVKEQD